jgi:hypothetical protein
MAGYEETTRASYDEERDSRAVRPEPRPGEILDGRRDRLWRAAEALDNMLDTLTSRLVPVLLPEPVVALGAVEGETRDGSDLGAFLDHLTGKLESLGRRASELAGRIDL